MLAALTPIVVIVVLVVLNGLFVAAEFALVAARRSRLETLGLKVISVVRVADRGGDIIPERRSEES